MITQHVSLIGAILMLPNVLPVVEANVLLGKF